MNRRAFIKVTTTGGLMISVSPALMLEGCVLNTGNAKALLNTVIVSVEAVIKVAEPNATWVAPLEAALSALQSAETAWEGGSTVNIVISALNTIVGVVDVIPLTEPYAPLIAVLVAGVEAVLNVLIPTVTPTPSLVDQLNMRSAQKSRYVGQVALNKPHFYQTPVGAYKAQWNAAAEKAGLVKAKI